MSADDLLLKLNEQQREAVLDFENPLLVLAGAGSGKTRMLTHKMAYGISKGLFNPQSFLAVTFTNKAAREMMGRVQQLVELASTRITGGTFHSAGHRILRRYAELLGYTPRFSILDREDATDLMGAALADISPDVTARRLPRPRLLVDLYSFVINTGQELGEVLTDRAPQFIDEGDLIADLFERESRFLDREGELGVGGHGLMSERLGAGGFGVVYRAVQPLIEREVAIKVLRPDLAATLGPERFLREIEISAKLTHPGVGAWLPL